MTTLFRRLPWIGLLSWMAAAALSASPDTGCGGEGRKCQEALLAIEERADRDSSFESMRCRLMLLLRCGSKHEIRVFVPGFVRRFAADSAGALLSARGLSAAKDWKGAAKLLEGWYRRTGSIEFIKALSQVYRENRQQELAESMAEKMLLMDSTRADAWWLKGDLIFSRTLIQKFRERLTRNERFREALRFYRKAAELDSANAAYLAGIGDVYAEIGVWDSALIAYDRAVLAAPRDRALLLKCGGALLNRKKADRALLMYEQAFSLDSMDLDLLQSIEECHRFLGTADSYYLTGQERLADALPETLSIRYNLGLEYLRRDMAGPAERALRRVLDRDQGFAEANRALAGLLLAQDRILEALPFLERQAGRTSASERDFLNLAAAGLKMGDTLKAVQAWEAALKKNPLNGRAAYAAAVHYFNLRRYGDVLRVLKEGLTYDDPPGAARMAGVALFELSMDAPRALRLLKTCLGTAEEDERLFYLIAVLHERNRDFPAAVKAFNQCLAKYPDSPNAGYYRDRIKAIEIGR